MRIIDWSSDVCSSDLTFCKLFDLGDIGTDPDLAANNQRVLARDRILPVVRALFAATERSELVERLERAGLPFAPIAKPGDLFDAPHLNEGGLVPITLDDGRSTTEVRKSTRLNASH